MTDLVLAGERVDDLQRGGLVILQDPKGYCFSMDAVLLSGFAEARAGEAVLDLGTGSGVLPLLLSAKTQASSFTGLEIDPETADRARRSAAMNGLEEKIRIVCGDIREAERLLGAGRYQVVVSNPPYLEAGSGKVSENPKIALAKHEIACTLADVVHAAARCLSSGGRFYMVHRARRTADVTAALRREGLGLRRMRFVHPTADRPAELVLVCAERGAAENAVIEAPLIISLATGEYTEEINEWYGDR